MKRWITGARWRHQYAPANLAGPTTFALLPLSETAREYPYRRSRESESRPAAVLAQAVALNHGSGRVVMFGEAAALTAQASRMSNGEPFRFGINRGDLDNAQLVLNVLHWLTRLL